MTDEQLQSLFAGMQRRLEKRLDAMEQRIADSAQRIVAQVDAELDALETRLLAEF
jgi:hypothetical protein